MAASLSRACAVVLFALAWSGASCARQEKQAPPPHAAQSSGTLRVEGLHAPVTVARDQWGIPHIVAGNTDDLFFAQGFVQAQDRLFQMDLWKRSVQGRLAEVLGANFIQRDSMTRRIQFRGDLEREWASYGPDARRIAVAFTNGINAWVRIARRDPPEEFVLAGWPPEFWRPEELLNRTDAFMASTGALVELLRARAVAAVGLQKADAVLPAPGTDRVQPDPEVDLSAITFVVSDAVRRVGTPPFFLTLAGQVTDAPRPGGQHADSQPAPTAKTQSGAIGGNPAELPSGIASRPTLWVDGGRQTSAGGPTVGIETTGALDAPSRAYLVHLTAPGWNVIGATRPWLPGVIVGHNERIAWAMTPLAVDTQDIAVEQVNPADPHQVRHNGRWVDMSVDHERVAVKGRDQPVEYERLYTSNGVVIAQDKQRGLVYTLRWTGTEPGGAGELAALDLGRADSWSRFREVIDRWTSPPAEFVYADIDGAVGRWNAGLVPQRVHGGGALPTAGWSGDRIWSSVARLSDREGVLDRSGKLAASDSSTRAILEVLNSPAISKALPKDVEETRNELGAAGAPQPILKVFYAVRRLALANLAIPEELRDEIVSAVDPATPGIDPVKALFGGDSMRVDLLTSVLKDIANSSIADHTNPSVTFEHPLAVFDTSRRRFNVLALPGPTSDGRMPDSGNRDVVGSRPEFRLVLSAKDWNRSVAINTPGQSGSPATVHYDDLARRWASGEDIPLSFNQLPSTSEVSEVLTLKPRLTPDVPDSR